MSVAFLLTALIIVLTPGTGVLYTLSVALARGARAGIIAAVGCTLGIVPPMVAALMGLAAVLQASAAAFQIVKLLGVGYLLVMAWATLRDRETLTAQAGPKPRSALRVVVSGILLNILNPKLVIFFVAFLPQFVSAHDPYASLRMVELSGVFMLLTLLVFSAYGVCAAAVRTQLLGRPRLMVWVRRLFAGSFVGLAARLALTER